MEELQKKIERILNCPQRRELLEEVINNLDLDLKYPLGTEVLFKVCGGVNNPFFKEGVIVKHNYTKGTYTIAFITKLGYRVERNYKESAIVKAINNYGR